MDNETNPIAEASKKLMQEHPEIKVLFHEAPDLTDPLGVAEEITGVRYDDPEAGEGFDNPTMGLGLLLLHERSRRAKQLADATKDTSFHMETEAYRSVIEDIGFKLALHIPFDYVDDEYHSEKTIDEVLAYHKSGGRRVEIVSHTPLDKGGKYKVRHYENYYIYWYRGMLLKWDTFRGSRNGAECLLNLKPKSSRSNLFSVPHLSGSWEYAHPGEEPKEKRELWAKSPTFCEDYVGVNHFDAREFLRKQIQRCEREFEILPVWKKQGFMWLLHHGDTHNKRDNEYDYEAITRERIAMLPQEIQKAIAGV